MKTGFSFPGDLGLIIRTLGKLVYYLLLIRRRPLDGFLERDPHNGDPEKPLSPDAMETLKKVRRICNFFMIRLLGSSRPCLPRTLVLASWCRELGLQSEVVIGVRREDSRLAGHSWLLLRGSPFMEDEKDLAEYQPMVTGQGK